MAVCHLSEIRVANRLYDSQLVDLIVDGDHAGRQTEFE